MGKKIRNKDIAARLGVSGTLVSLVLNNKADQQGIRKDTQEKVLKLAAQMGYFESLHEKNKTSPAEEKPGVLGMIVPYINDPFVIQISQYLQKAFSSIGVGFSIISKDPDDQRYDRLVGTFRRFFSGLILLGEAGDQNTIRSLRSTNYPFILLENSAKSLYLNTVSTDISAGNNIVVDHLCKLGYKNIIIIANKKSFQDNRTVIKGITDAIAQTDSMNKAVVIELDIRIDIDELDYGHFEKFLRPPYRADAMVIINAALVYPVMTLLRKKKLRVPQDIAVLSMEEGAGFDLMYSPVTCLRKPFSSMATKVANMIWTEVKTAGKGKFKRQVNIVPELIVRHSCGAT